MAKLTVFRHFLVEQELEVPGELYDRLVADESMEARDQARGELAALVDASLDWSIHDAQSDGILVMDPANEDAELLSTD